MTKPNQNAQKGDAQKPDPKLPKPSPNIGVDSISARPTQPVPPARLAEQQAASDTPAAAAATPPVPPTPPAPPAASVAPAAPIPPQAGVFVTITRPAAVEAEPTQRLTLEIPRSLHKLIKMDSMARDSTMTDDVLALLEQVYRPKA